MIERHMIPYIKSNVCQIQELGLSCIGCCGKIAAQEKDVEHDIRKNTIEHKHKDDMKTFIWRHPPNALRKSGICPNLVFDDVRKNRIFCPAHPEKNNGADHREGYCDTLHLCKAAFLYDLWTDDIRKRFIAFLRHKVRRGQLDWYIFSIKMRDDSLLNEFEERGYYTLR
ncbi:MAG: hypothetical protein KJ574_03735 [Nanoarchaeota archaeon]|nr:hypothetical protein [Nanoarchaeota archaeon]